MPSLGTSRSRWPVVAWIRLTLPPAPAPMMLMPGPPPPPSPPLDLLAPNPVTTDPRKRVFAYEEDHDEYVVRLVWDADDAGVLEAEYRAPLYGERPTNVRVLEFWAAVKVLIAPLGTLPVESADPRPRPSAPSSA
ncbi:MAG: hypothetical protein WBG19_01890 [Thermoplasmata archaeon]